MTPYDALKVAREKTLDLVEVSPTAQPPVCRIMDYGKYLYQQEKREREAKKHQHQITVKEVKFRINVDDHDYETKKNHVLRFLAEGDKVKATIFFRGREMTRQGSGTRDSGAPDQGPRRQGDRGISSASGRQHAASDPGPAENAGSGQAAQGRSETAKSEAREAFCSAPSPPAATTVIPLVVYPVKASLLAGFARLCCNRRTLCRR